MSVRTAGVSIALNAGEFNALNPADRGTLMREVHAHLETELRKHIADVKPKGQPSFQIDGPNNDPIQGNIYTVTMAVPVETDDLPIDCTAYKAMNGAIPL